MKHSANPDHPMGAKYLQPPMLGSGRLLPGGGGWEILIGGQKKISIPLSRPTEKFNPPSRGPRKVQPPLSQPSMYHLVTNLVTRPPEQRGWHQNP